MSRSTAAQDGAPVVDQVFVDASGRRGRVLRWVGALLGLGCLVYVGVVLLVANSSRLTGPLPVIPVEGDGLVPGFPAATAPPGVLSALPTTRPPRPTTRAPAGMSGPGLHSCEQALTPDIPMPIEVNPPPGRPTDPRPLYTPSGGCRVPS